MTILRSMLLLFILAVVAGLVVGSFIPLLKFLVSL